MKKRILLIALIGMSYGIKAQEYVESKTSIPSNNANNAIGEKNSIWRNSTMAPSIQDNFPNQQNWWSIFQTQFADTRYDAQLAFGLNKQDLWLRYNYNGNWQNWKKLILTDHNGDVGIGTSSPKTKLDVNGQLKTYRNYIYGGANYNIILGEDTGNAYVSNINGYGVISSGGYYYGANLRQLNTGNTAYSGIQTRPDGSIVFENAINGIAGGTITAGERMRVHTNGNVGIGTTNPGVWKLAVNGEIRAKEIKVETGWSDFVFENDYKLPTLKEVENHIKQKGHLKDIPSAKEVAKNGILLGKMNSKLLQKIEELTLYTIQQHKGISELKEKVGNLEKENNSLKTVNTKLLELQKRLEKLEKK